MSHSSGCFFTKLVSWSDHNLSAAFLTAGNFIVLLLLLSRDAISWFLFGLVFGVLPLGLAARLAGMDKNVRMSLSPKSSGSNTPSYYESHIVSQLTTVGLIRLGVYLVILATVIGWLGIPGALLVLGNAAMLLPLAYMKYSPLVVQQVKAVHLDKLAGLVKQSIQTGFETIADFGPMAPAVSGGIVAFLAVIIASYLATSQALLVTNMSLLGYGIIITFAVVPPSVVEKLVSSVIPSPAVVEKISDRVHLSSAIRRITDLVLWENYKNSVTAFAAFYGLYFVSSYIGVVVPVALATGLFVAFTLTPSTLKEKAFAELDKTIKQVRTSVTSRISLTPPLPEKEKEDEPSSPRSAKKSPARKPVSPLVDPIVPEPEALKEVNDAPNIEE